MRLSQQMRSCRKSINVPSLLDVRLRPLHSATDPLLNRRHHIAALGPGRAVRPHPGEGRLTPNPVAASLTRTCLGASSAVTLAALSSSSRAKTAAPTSRVVYVDNDRFKSGCAHICWASQAS
jgi:hypothetical protein